MASSTTPTRRTNAGWTPPGACTSGSTARHAGATRPARTGGAATTSTTANDACGRRRRPHRGVRRPERAGLAQGVLPGAPRGRCTMSLQRERPFLLTLLVLVVASWAILIWQSRTTQGMGGGLTMGMGAALFLAI